MCLQDQQRNRLSVFSIFLLAVILCVSNAATGQSDGRQHSAEPADVRSISPPWRDLKRAIYNLEVAMEIKNSLAESINRITQELRHEKERNEQLGWAESATRLLNQEAQQVVVMDYIAGSPLDELVFVLAGSKPTDALWRLALLEEVAEIVDEVADAPNDVSKEQERTQLRIHRLESTLTAIRLQLSDAEQAIDEAKWVVYIAEINDMADRELAQNGFIEPTERQWYNLRFCESTNDYTVASANGLFFGAYQFEPRTWRTVGGTGNPAAAPPEEQDARARLLYARRGDQPWPRAYCGRWLPRN